MRAFVLACLLTCFSAAYAAAPEPATGDNGLRIRVEGGGWGGATPEQIEPVLRAVAAELMERLPRKPGATIVVRHTEGNPISLYERDRDGSYQVRLHASDQRWHLYVFEFAHEFTHLLSNYDENVVGSGRHNQWFEESLCETASLFALERLAARWERLPESSPWKQRAPKLRAFFELLVSEDHRNLPPETSAAAWIRTHETELRHNPYLRDRNDLVAKLMLPFFERDPRSWEAVTYMNLDPEDAGAPLAGYLRRWHDRAPAAYKALVASIRGLFVGGGESSRVVASDTSEADDRTAPIGAASPLR